jgi:TIGR03009 family protein
MSAPSSRCFSSLFDLTACLALAAWLLVPSLVDGAPQTTVAGPVNATAGTGMQEPANLDGQSRAPSNQAPAQPEWIPLPPEQQQHVDQLLEYWQKSSDQIRRCTCEFTRWDYDPTYCDYRNPQTQELAAFAVWRGEIRYAAPDKAMLETTELWKFAMEGDDPTMEQSQDQNLKLKWMCDGKYVYEYDFVNKRLTDMSIPDAFQGDGLVNSPLPFLFGANRETLLNRFWIRPITPANATDEYWLQVIPKRLQDARTYSRVELVIARQDFLPKSMILFSANYDPKENPVSQAYVFENRKINGHLSAIQDFLGNFIRPKTPFGWERVEQKSFFDDSLTAQKEELEHTRK